MIDALVLRSDIIALLGNLLGTYSFPDNGGTDHAIAVLPDADAGWNYPPSGTKITGVEVVIVRPYPGVSPLLGGDRTKTYVWHITLKQWSSASNLLAATEALVNGLDYFISDPIPAPPNAGLGILEQVKIDIAEYTYQEI